MSNATVLEEKSAQAGRDLSGKYLTFTLGTEEFGLEILKVREIIGFMDITAVPRAPHCVRGVINLRGQVIPVIDMRTKFEMEAVDVTEQTCIIVVEVTSRRGRFSTGIIVDSVREVLDIESSDIEPAPDFDQNVDTSFILGMGKINGDVKILLDIDKVLGNGELEAVID